MSEKKFSPTQIEAIRAGSGPGKQTDTEEERRAKARRGVHSNPQAYHAAKREKYELEARPDIDNKAVVFESQSAPDANGSYYIRQVFRTNKDEANPTFRLVQTFVDNEPRTDKKDGHEYTLGPKREFEHYLGAKELAQRGIVDNVDAEAFVSAWASGVNPNETLVPPAEDMPHHNEDGIWDSVLNTFKDRMARQEQKALEAEMDPDSWQYQRAQAIDEYNKDVADAKQAFKDYMDKTDFSDLDRKVQAARDMFLQANNNRFIKKVPVPIMKDGKPVMEEYDLPDLPIYGKKQKMQKVTRPIYNDDGSISKHDEEYVDNFGRASLRSIVDTEEVDEPIFMKDENGNILYEDDKPVYEMEDDLDNIVGYEKQLDENGNQKKGQRPKTRLVNKSTMTDADRIPFSMQDVRDQLIGKQTRLPYSAEELIKAGQGAGIDDDTINDVVYGSLDRNIPYLNDLMKFMTPNYRGKKPMRYGKWFGKNANDEVIEQLSEDGKLKYDMFNQPVFGEDVKEKWQEVTDSEGNPARPVADFSRPGNWHKNEQTGEYDPLFDAVTGDYVSYKDALRYYYVDEDGNVLRNDDNEPLQPDPNDVVETEDGKLIDSKTNLPISAIPRPVYSSYAKDEFGDPLYRDNTLMFDKGTHAVRKKALINPFTGNFIHGKFDQLTGQVTPSGEIERWNPNKKMYEMADGDENDDIIYLKNDKIAPWYRNKEGNAVPLIYNKATKKTMPVRKWDAEKGKYLIETEDKPYSEQMFAYSPDTEKVLKAIFDGYTFDEKNNKVLSRWQKNVEDSFNKEVEDKWNAIEAANRTVNEAQENNEAINKLAAGIVDGSMNYQPVFNESAVIKGKDDERFVNPNARFDEKGNRIDDNRPSSELKQIGLTVAKLAIDNGIIGGRELDSKDRYILKTLIEAGRYDLIARMPWSNPVGNQRDKWFKNNYTRVDADKKQKKIDDTEGKRSDANLSQESILKALLNKRY